jgi:tRNA pseudouridine55 synthase
VLLLDKPLGLSSTDALSRAKRLFRAEKAGHTGTLDPLATGLLPLCFGAATKFSQIGLEADKSYRATVQLGVCTTTGDAEGEVLQRRDVIATRADIDAVCAAFVGEILQVPPMHSALKRDGKPLYEYARAGIEVERVPRRVTLHSVSLADVAAQGTGNAWVIDVRCSKGTYIRTLAEDMGTALGCGAHLSALRRTASGPLELCSARTLDELGGLAEDQLDALLQPVDSLIADWPIVRLDDDGAGRFLSGVRRRLPLPDTAQVRVYGPDERAFLGSGHIRAGELISTRLLSPPEVRDLVDGPRRVPISASQEASTT